MRIPLCRGQLLVAMNLSDLVEWHISHTQPRGATGTFMPISGSNPDIERTSYSIFDAYPQ